MTKTLSSTAVYAYTTLISMIVCLPFAIGMEGPQLQAGAAAAIAKVRQLSIQSFYTGLVLCGVAWYTGVEARRWVCVWGGG
jgi:diaminopimelate decarboxylase/solute carrier family 35 protein E1